MADHDARIYELTGGLCPIVLTRDWKDSAVERPREWKFGPAVVVNRPDIVVKQWQSSGTLIVPLDPLPIITWTDQEYSDLLSDPDWTLEETTTLFDLAGAFDLRFTLIHDRYPEDWPPKTIEQMQHRYYSVNRILLTARLPRDDPNTRIEIEKYNYNLTMQEMRKANLEALLARPAELIKEEELLVRELCKFEISSEKWIKMREALLKAHTDHEMLPQAVAALEMKKKRTISDSRSTTIPKKREYDDYAVKRDRLPAGMSSRSSRMVGVRPSMVPKVNSMLEELGLGYRPHMHTMEITARFEEVRALLQSKAELVKAIEKAEADLKSASDRKIQVQEELVSGQLSKSLKRAASSGASTPRPIKRSKNS